jgi:hypothetical protein
MLSLATISFRKRIYQAMVCKIEEIHSKHVAASAGSNKLWFVKLKKSIQNTLQLQLAQTIPLVVF